MVGVARNLLDNAKIWTEISGSLDTLSNMAVRKRKSFKADPEGTEFRTRRMKGLSDLPNLAQSEWMLPDGYLSYRMATGKSSVRERGKFVEKQQLLYLMIDSSGSMYGENVSKACGILFNRLKAVVEGDAQVYFRFFDDSLSEEHFAGDHESAKEAMRILSKHNFRGGGTQIAPCAHKCLDRISEIMESNEHQFAVPELIIITDGIDNTIDRLTVKNFADVGTKLHSFIIDYENKPLIELARQTGGVGMENL